MNKSAESEKFENFLCAFGATQVLLKRAHENGFLIEGLVLYASLVDGFCRICLVLKEQLEKKATKINERYIYQNEDDQNFNERKIYQLSFEKKIIDRKLFEELSALYDIRNKAIHRFFISEVEYCHLEIVCDRYQRVFEKLWDITHELESEQIRKGVGMTRTDERQTGKHEANTYEGIARKIKSGSERNLAKTLNCTSVEEVIEFASKNGLVAKCACDHEKIHHLSLDVLKKKNSRDLDDGLVKCSAKNCGCLKFELQS